MIEWKISNKTLYLKINPQEDLYLLSFSDHLIA